ncbi:MAG: DUF4338 domain-containing protein [Opitutaceae bacterium]|nr:DUF4338 domain-containing protein [Opitutaceae bacterium]
MGEAQLEAIQGLADGNPSWSRRQLADALVQGWVWRNAVRRLKDMSCRLMLARLEAKGLVRLPARSRLSPKLKAKVIAAVSGGGNISASWSPFWRRPTREPGAGRLRDGDDRVVLSSPRPVSLPRISLSSGSQSALPGSRAVWASAALKVGCRANWLGWTGSQRMAGLARVANNTLYLILLWLRVPQLASHLLGLMTRQLFRDWRVHTGQRLALGEDLRGCSAF